MNDPTKSELIESCTQYLLDRFNYQSRMEQVHEWMDVDKLTEALRKHEDGDLMAINLMMEEAARMLCRRSAEALIKAHGDGWQKFYEALDDYWSNHSIDKRLV